MDQFSVKDAIIICIYSVATENDAMSVMSAQVYLEFYDNADDTLPHVNVGWSPHKKSRIPPPTWCERQALRMYTSNRSLASRMMTEAGLNHEDDVQGDIGRIGIVSKDGYFGVIRLALDVKGILAEVERRLKERFERLFWPFWTIYSGSRLSRDSWTQESPIVKSSVVQDPTIEMWFI